MANDAWEPANDVERALRDAWLANDNVAFLRTLATAPLYLPGFADRESNREPNREPDRESDRRSDRESDQRLLTWRHNESLHVLVFTSPEALFQQLTGVVDGWRLTSVTELNQARPDLSWGVAISPNTPIGACLDADELAALADAVNVEALFHPATRAEAVMFDAKRRGDPEAYLDALVLSDVLVPLAAPAGPKDLADPAFPWLIDWTGEPALTAYTSDLRLAMAVSDQTPSVRMPMMALLHAWPDRTVRLTVNPGTPIDSAFGGKQIVDLIEWAKRMALRAGDVAGPVGVARVNTWHASAGPVSETPAAGAAPISAATFDATEFEVIGEFVEAQIEVGIADADVDGYLSGAYTRISGEPRPAGAASGASHVIRWRPDGPHDGSLVDGARLVRIHADGERVIATYQADLRRWLPAIGDLLRGNALG